MAGAGRFPFKIWAIAIGGAALLGCSNNAPAPPVVTAQKVDKAEESKSVPAASEKAATEEESASKEAMEKKAAPAETKVEPSAEPAKPIETPPAAGETKKPEEATPPAETKAEAAPAAPPGDAAPSSENPASGESKPAAPNRADLVRLIAFAPAGPMVIDLAVYLDGEPLGKSRTEAIDRIYHLLDEDRDGRIAWEQFIKLGRVKSGLYGNAAIADGANLNDLLEKYDIVKNGRVDKEELPRFFSDDRGATKAFSILAPGRPLGSPGENSAILAWLDADGDGQLSAEERAEARAQLRIRDADDDRVLSSDELMTRTETAMPGMAMTRAPSPGPPSGMLLGPNPRWESLSYYLEEIYAGAGKKLRTSHFPGTEELAKFIDGNKDGKISAIELQNFENAPANLTLTLRYVSRRGKEQPQPKLEASPLTGDWAKWQAAWKQDGQRAGFTAEEYSIAFEMADLVGFASEMDIAKSIFEQVDADKNGYLEEKEFTMPQVVGGLTFAQVDENGDGKVYLDEVEKVTAERQVVAGTQAVVKVEVTGDPFLGVLDRDDDGRLSDREIREAEKNLTALDKDGDGLVGVGELPQSMKISVIRGIVSEGTVVPSSPGVIASAPIDAPLWFSKMDANCDGELNEIEFIGESEQFTKLDANQDGTITLDEVAPKTEPSKTNTPVTGESGAEKAAPETSASTTP